jgi:prevent-host-death family protein
MYLKKGPFGYSYVRYMFAKWKTRGKMPSPDEFGQVNVDLAKDLVYTDFMEVNIHEAKTNLSKLLARVALGEEVIIAKAGTPVAKLVRFEVNPKTRVFGSAKGEFTVPDDFNEADPEIEDLFYKSELFPKTDVSSK